MPSYEISGGSALCDERDSDLLLDGTWRVCSGRVMRMHMRGRKYLGHELFHRVIMECPPEMVVDHINGDTLDNRRENLRVCDEQENRWNRKVYKNNSCGIRGVYYDASRAGGRPWRAKITKHGKVYRLGSFETAIEAQDARIEAELQLFGEFAPTSSRQHE